MVSMVLYHGTWDLVYLFGFPWAWYGETAAFLWQQSICWGFIFLSGFCLSLGKSGKKRGLLVFLLSFGLTATTFLAMPEMPVIFGVLSLIGFSMLLVGALRPYLEKIPAIFGFIGSFLLFFASYRIPDMNIGQGLSGGISYVAAFFGFPNAYFVSSDYFPVVPWLFLFLAGFYAYGLWGTKVKDLSLAKRKIPVFSFLGRHALLLYLLHQPVIFGILYLILL